MARITLTLKNSAGDTLATHALDTSGAPQHIEAMHGAYYQFTDAATGIGPEQLVTERKGDDLYIAFDDGSDLIIDHYFSQGQGALVGTQANGGLHNYPVATLSEHELAAEVAAAQAFAPNTVDKAGLAALGGLALVGGGIAIAAHNHDKHHHDNNVAPATATPALTPAATPTG